MNLDDFQRQIRWRLVIGLLGLAFVLFLLDVTGNLDNAFVFLRNPVAFVMDWTAARTDAFADVLAGPRDLQAARAEVEALEARVAELERENEDLREIQGEYQLLQDLFNQAREAPEFRREVASVIGQDTSPYFRSIIIDKGSRDGIAVGMPVESARGLVGQVYRVSDNSAQVVLITDSLSNIPARLVDTRATGMIHGGGQGITMNMDWISLEADVSIGEVVLTSGLGGKFPQDLIIGRVQEVERREAALFQTAIVQPAVDFGELEIVFVITDFTPLDTSNFDLPPE